MGGRKRNAPCARLQLQVEEARSHCGLPVRRQLHTISRDELLHPAQVMQQLFLIQNRCRQTQVFAQEVPSKLDDLGRLHGSFQEAQAFLKGSNP